VEHSQLEFRFRCGFGRAGLAAVGALVVAFTATVGAVAQPPCAPAAGWERFGGDVALPDSGAVGEQPRPAAFDTLAPGPDRDAAAPASSSSPLGSDGTGDAVEPGNTGVPAAPAPASNSPAETRKEPERSGKPLRRLRIRDAGPTDYLQPRDRTLPA
jgi:hypothetical protein